MSKLRLVYDGEEGRGRSKKKAIFHNRSIDDTIFGQYVTIQNLEYCIPYINGGYINGVFERYGFNNNYYFRELLPDFFPLDHDPFNVNAGMDESKETDSENNINNENDVDSEKLDLDVVNLSDSDNE